MIFTISTSTLLSQLNLVLGAVGTNNTLPILEDFLFTVDAGVLTISATDLETSMSTEVDIMGNDSGKIAIPAKILVDILKGLTDQPLSFHVDEQTKAIQIVSQNGNYKLTGEDGDDFPSVPTLSDGERLTLSATLLSDAISKTLFAVSNDELRFAMTGVFCKIDERGVTFASTDAHKLVQYKRTDVSSEKKASFIIPKKALTLLNKALPSKEADVIIAYDEVNAFFEFEGLQLICRLIDARYPDYHAVIPVENPNRLTINRADFLKALRRISIFANKSNYQVKLSFADDEVQLHAQDLDFSNEAKEKLICNYKGEAMDIAFNAKFLIELLNAVDSEEVILKMSIPSRAGVLVPAEQISEEDLLMLVMPISLDI
ncbi:MAG: DNA polymerase III subunit beta [Chitinophagales bacterium]